MIVFGGSRNVGSAGTGRIEKTISELNIKFDRLLQQLEHTPGLFAGGSQSDVRKFEPGTWERISCYCNLSCVHTACGTVLSVHERRALL